ncbi:MAG: hypothetical protein D6801_06230 [Alphaproteobacteria bacterium]|nr:MAG: hypothetical protein D6801_06230 [Alphaproteobacteria bacterium]
MAPERGPRRCAALFRAPCPPPNHTLNDRRGDDTFVFAAATDSGKGGAADRIMDFSLSEDMIDLGALGGSATVSLADKGFGTLVKVDADGDGTVDFHIKVIGTHGLTLEHFIL